MDVFSIEVTPGDSSRMRGAGKATMNRRSWARQKLDDLAHGNCDIEERARLYAFYMEIADPSFDRLEYAVEQINRIADAGYPKESAVEYLSFWMEIDVEDSPPTANNPDEYEY